MTTSYQPDVKIKQLPRLLLLAIAMLLALGATPAGAEGDAPPGTDVAPEPARITYSDPEAAPITAQPAQDAVPDSYIVVLRDGVDARSVAQEHANAHALRVAHVYSHALKGYTARIPAASLARVKADRRVLFVSADRVVHAVGQSTPTGVNRIETDKSSTLAGNGSGDVAVAVAVLDTGIDRNHPDLNVKGGKNCYGGRSYSDGNGHGTHVAGTVAAKDNDLGVVGVAPGAPLYAVKVLRDNGSGSWSAIICGIDWVTANAGNLGIKVANMSLAGGGSDDGNCGNTNGDALHRAICKSVGAGITYVAAAGNSSTNFAGSVPAAYDEVLTVGAMTDYNGVPGGGATGCSSDSDDSDGNFSNYAVPGTADVNHTIAGPGVCIYSTAPGGGYATMSGTSMASPHVAGAAALCLSSSATTGKCTGGPADVMGDLRSDAKARSDTSWYNQEQPYYGYANDPNWNWCCDNSNTRYFGYLVYVEGY